METKITRIQRFSTHDGDGIRTTVFFHGCPLHCWWCHNPETADDAPAFYYTESNCIRCASCEKVCPQGVHEVGGEHIIRREKCIGCLACERACPTNAIEGCVKITDTESIVKDVMQDAAFYGENGGITLSGGEPMAQGAAAIELMQALKQKGVSTAMETSGAFAKKYVSQLPKVCDLLLWDIKDGNPERLRKNTGADLGTILDNLYAIDENGGKTELRCIMIKGVNMDEDSFSAIAEIYHKLRNCRGVTLIPYHPYGSSKSLRLGCKANADKAYVPANADLAYAEKFFKSKNVKILK